MTRTSDRGCRWEPDDPRVEEAASLMLSERQAEARVVLAAVMRDTVTGGRTPRVTLRQRVDQDRVRALLEVNTGPTRCREIARELGISERTVLRIESET